MKQLLVAALLSLVVVSCGVPGVATPHAVQAAHGWRLAGKYRSYEAACHMAAQLEARGYQTCIKKQGGYYCVYCR